MSFFESILEFWFWNDDVKKQHLVEVPRRQQVIKNPHHRAAFFVCTLSLSHVQLLVTPWTVARQAPLSPGFFRQECWSGLPYSLPGDLPHPGIEPSSLTSPALAGGFLITSATREAQGCFRSALQSLEPSFDMFLVSHQ